MSDLEIKALIVYGFNVVFQSFFATVDQESFEIQPYGSVRIHQNENAKKKVTNT